VFFKLISHLKLRAVVWAKRRMQKVFNKRVPIIVANVFWRKTNIS